MVRPSLDIDLFTEEALLDPWPLYEQIREAGPAVYLNRLDVWAMGRYAEVRSSLQDWETFSSAQGIALNKRANDNAGGRLLSSDPPLHDQLRGVLAQRLIPRHLRDVGEMITERAEALVEGLVARGEFDAVVDLGRALPMGIVLDLIGLPQEGRDRVIDWADAVFMATGPEGPRTDAAYQIVAEQVNYLATIATKEQLTPGSMGRAIYEASEAGKLDAESCLPLMSAYITAGLDTTINSIANSVYYFAHNPDQWDDVRKHPEIIANAFNEVLRIESPAQYFTRVATRDVELDGVTLPLGSRVMMLYASANRDERRWENPTTFDVRREAAEHVAFGSGVHGCAGQGLARLEGHAILKALSTRVARFEVGQPQRRLNQLIRGFRTLPTRVEAN